MNYWQNKIKHDKIIKYVKIPHGMLACNLKGYLVSACLDKICKYYACSDYCELQKFTQKYIFFLTRWK